MPHATEGEPFNHISVKELHPTFGAEVHGVDFSKPVPDDTFAEISEAMAKYGVCVFRKTGLADESHLAFARKFGELDNMERFLSIQNGGHRLSSLELFDVGNFDKNGNLHPLDSKKAQFSKGNGVFHVDSSFNPIRCRYSLLLAHVLPPPGTGGNTEFADTRTAFDELPEDLKEHLLERDYVAAHSLPHSRKQAAPEFFKDLNPEDHPMMRHKLVQVHEPSGRTNLYIASHIHHLEGLDRDESKELFERLFTHATQPKYVLDLEYEDPGDLVIWDNTCVMHRSKGGEFEGKYKRDMRRATVHDASSTAWGLNGKDTAPQGLP